MTFVGSDLYLATVDGLSAIKNAMAATCLGGCNGALIQDGFSGTDHVGLTSDGINHLYVAINGQGVYRYTISSGTWMSRSRHESWIVSRVTTTAL